MSNAFSTFLEELTKISVQLTKGEKRRQALQFAGLGVTTLPILAAAQSRISSGRWIPKGVRPHRFLGAAALGGAFWGGALPSIRHMISRSNIHGAKRRLEARKELAQLVPGAMPPVPMPAVKQAASKRIAGYQQTRKGRRPIRAAKLLKKASLAGQDLRLPVMGGTKFPTKDSLTGSKSLLTKSIGSAEVGPTPSIGRLSPSRPKIRDIAATVPGAQNLMPKVGSHMTSFEKDPLVQYLKKQAAEDIPKKVKTEKGGALQKNEPDMPQQNEAKELSSVPPEATKEWSGKAVKELGSTLSELFSHSKAFRDKNEKKDHPPKTGAVDRILSIK